MFHANELLISYGRECHARHLFWSSIGVAKGSRGKFAKWLGYDSAIQFWYVHRDDEDPASLRFLRTMAFRKHCYENFKKERREMRGIEQAVTGRTVTSDWFFIDDIATKAVFKYKPLTGTCEPACIPNEREETMYSEIESQRNYLETRLRNIKHDHDAKLRKDFNIEPQFPSTLKEALERLNSGVVKYPTKERLEEQGYDFEGGYYGFVFDMVDWGYPKADNEGYGKATKEMENAFTATRDTIRVLPLEEGLKALREFENKTFR